MPFAGTMNTAPVPVPTRGDAPEPVSGRAAGSNLDGWFRRRGRERSEALILSGDHLTEVTSPRVAGSAP
jgi:hypothetical protein